METGTIIALLALLVAIANALLNGRKDTRSDAAALAEIKAGVNSANAGISDLRVDLRRMNDAISDHSERLASLETRVTNLER